MINWLTNFLITQALAAETSPVNLLVPISNPHGRPIVGPPPPPISQISDFNQYLVTIFWTALYVSVALAVVTMAWWGLRMIVSKVPGLKVEAKTRLWDILWGVAILLAAWLILKTINPCILQTVFTPTGVTSPCAATP